MKEKGAVKEVKQQSLFYHRKIAHSGGSRYLAVGKLLPPDWLFVRVSIVEQGGGVCLLKVEKLA